MATRNRNEVETSHCIIGRLRNDYLQRKGNRNEKRTATKEEFAKFGDHYLPPPNSVPKISAAPVMTISVPAAGPRVSTARPSVT